MAMLTARQKLGTLAEALAYDTEHRTPIGSAEAQFIEELWAFRNEHKESWEPTKHQDERLTDIYNRVMGLGQS